MLLPHTKPFLRFPHPWRGWRKKLKARECCSTKTSSWIRTYFLEKASFRHNRKSLSASDPPHSSLLTCCVTSGERFILPSEVCVGNPTGSWLSLALHIVGAPWRLEPSSQGFPVWGDYLHGIHAVKINMNSSGPSLRGSQREARSPAHVCCRQEQTFPCKLDSPHSLQQPAGMGVGQGDRPKAVSPTASQAQASLPPSFAPSLPPSSLSHLNTQTGKWPSGFSWLKWKV